MADIDRYFSARMACQFARNLLAGHDFTELVRACDRADALGPILDPTLYREKAGAMDEDAKVFRAALAFLGAWSPGTPKQKESDR